MDNFNKNDFDRNNRRDVHEDGIGLPDSSNNTPYYGSGNGAGNGADNGFDNGSGNGGGNGFGNGGGRPPQYYPRLTPEYVRAEIKRSRHKKEVPLYIWLIVIGIISFIVVTISTVNGEDLVNQAKDIFADTGVVLSSSTIELIAAAAGLLSGVGSLIVLIIVILFNVYKLYAGQLSYSIRVSEHNFPEIYQKVKEYTWLLGLKKEPEVYVQQMGGEINAYTSWVPGKCFIQLNAEIVDLAYMEHKDFETVYFTMAHEFGHIYLHHVQLKYIFWSMLINFFPVVGQFILGPALQRAREYSADRVGQALTDDVGKLDCMMMLSVGRHAYKYMDAGQYLQDILRGHNPIERFARWLVNLLSSHPIMPFRVRAIIDSQKKSGRLV